MKRITVLLSFAFLLTCLLTATVAFAKPAGSTAFLSDFAETPQQVVNQMEANRLIALRYARVFVQEPGVVLTHFRNDLSVLTLSESVDVQIYHLDDSGRIVNETKTLKAGTKVFADGSGRPVLEYGTGNPLTANLVEIGQPKSKPITEANNAGGSNAQTQNGVQGHPAPDTKTTIAETLKPVSSVTPTSTPVVPQTPGSTLVTNAPPAPGTSSLSGITPPVEPTTKVAGAQMSTGGSSMGGWIVPAGLAGAVVALAGGGGSGGGGTNNTPTGGTDPILPEVVPEPTSLVALGAGLIGLGGLISRRRKK